MSTERDTYRTLTAAAVMLVAAIAAVVSYLHVASLALRYGQPPIAAYLLPISIDGLVATSSLVMLRAARTAVSTPWLARTGLVLAVLATLGANVASGLPHGWPGALLAGWPAVAFVVSAETAIAMSRRRPSSSKRSIPSSSSSSTSRSRSSTSSKIPSSRRRQPARASAADTEAAALSALSGNPALTHKQLGAAIGTSERTARRVRARLNGHGPSDPASDAPRPGAGQEP